MKAVVLAGTGGPERLEVREVDLPVLEGDRDLLVRVKAAGVNPIDAKQRKAGPLIQERAPVILGCDGAGVVESVGAAVTCFRRGDEVYFLSGGIGGRPGTYAEFAVVDERLAASKPKNLRFAEAAVAPLALVTAWESLERCGGVRAGQTVLIHGGAGGVGHLAVQLAAQKGARVLATVGDPLKAALTKKLGAAETICYKERDFVQEVLERTAGRGVDLALDTVGGETFLKTLSSVRPYGRVVTLLLPECGPAGFREARVRNLDLCFVWMLAPQFLGLTKELERQGRILRECVQRFEDGSLRVVVSKEFGLEDVAEAHRLIETGSGTGKIALIVSD